MRTHICLVRDISDGVGVTIREFEGLRMFSALKNKYIFIKLTLANVKYYLYNNVSEAFIK